MSLSKILKSAAPIATVGALVALGIGAVGYSQRNSTPPGTIGIEGEPYSVFQSPRSKGISISGFVNDKDANGNDIRYRFTFNGSQRINEDGNSYDVLTKVSFCGAQKPIDTEKHCITYTVKADLRDYNGDFNRIVADARRIVPEGGFSVSRYKSPSTK